MSDTICGTCGQPCDLRKPIAVDDDGKFLCLGCLVKPAPQACADCRGTGRVELFSSVRPCVPCNGTGRVAKAKPPISIADLAASKGQDLNEFITGRIVALRQERRHVDDFIIADDPYDVPDLSREEIERFERDFWRKICERIEREIFRA